MTTETETKPKNRAADLLLQSMSDLSEEHWAAGWLTGTEYALWAAVLAGGDYSWGMARILPEEAAELRELAEESGGWWIWHDVDGEVFVSLSDWRFRFALWMRNQDKGDQTDADLRAEAEEFVDDRLSKVQQYGPSSLSGMLGLMVYGSADLPREVQIAQGVESLARTRDQHRRVWQGWQRDQEVPA